MKPRSILPELVMAAILVACVILAIKALGCTPAERKELAPAVVPAERAACVLLTVEGVGDICPTADELAPIARELLAFQVETGDAGARQPIARLPKAKHASQRRCTPLEGDAGAAK